MSFWDRTRWADDRARQPRPYALARARERLTFLIIVGSVLALVPLSGVFAVEPALTVRPPTAPVGTGATAVGYKLPAATPTSALAPFAPPPSTMPTTDLPGWKLIFNDDFTTPVAPGQFPAAVSSKWGTYLSGWKDTSKNGTYSPQIVSFSNSMMDIYLHTESGVHMVATPYPLLPGSDPVGHPPGHPLGQLYGRYAVRFRADPVPGYKTAWLLWPVSETWPRDGEVDFPDGEGDLTGTISAYMHRQGGTWVGDQDPFWTSATYSAWHVAVIEWTPTKVEFFLDGASIGEATDRIPNTPMSWRLQTETALTGPAPADNSAGHVQVDWVAVWSYAPTLTPALTPASMPTPTSTPTRAPSPSSSSTPTPPPDLSAPTMTALSAPRLVTSADASFTATFTGSDNVGVTAYQIRTKKGTSGTWSVTTTQTARARAFSGLAAGTWYIDVRARDAVGNLSAWRAAVVVIRPTAGPSRPLPATPRMPSRSSVTARAT
jgi:hypothetical protein